MTFWSDRRFKLTVAIFICFTFFYIAGVVFFPTASNLLDQYSGAIQLYGLLFLIFSAIVGTLFANEIMRRRERAFVVDELFIILAEELWLNLIRTNLIRKTIEDCKEEGKKKIPAVAPRATVLNRILQPEVIRALRGINRKQVVHTFAELTELVGEYQRFKHWVHEVNQEEFVDGLEAQSKELLSMIPSLMNKMLSLWVAILSGYYNRIGNQLLVDLGKEFDAVIEKDDEGKVTTCFRSSNFDERRFPDVDVIICWIDDSDSEDLDQEIIELGERAVPSERVIISPDFPASEETDSS